MAHGIMLSLRWSARITGLLLAALVLVMAIGEGPPNPLKQPLSVQVEFAGLTLMLLGFLLGWRWEAWAGSWLSAVCHTPGHRVDR